MSCKCADWEPNSKLINGIIAVWAVHSYGDRRGYTGKRFVFCPWCGTKLPQDTTAKPKASKRVRAARNAGHKPPGMYLPDDSGNVLRNLE